MLGSATPSVESYYNASAGKYGLADLNERYGNVQLTPLVIVDTKMIGTMEKYKIIISPDLQEAITQLSLRANR